MKMTLLDMVHDIMSDMSSDHIHSISDTEEGFQVAQIIKTTYYEMMNRRDWPHLKKLRTLESFADNEFPTYLRVPTDTKHINWMTYSQKTLLHPDAPFKMLKWLEPAKFVQYTNNRNPDNLSVSIITTAERVPLRVLNDVPPTYYTSFDDEIMVLDSWDKEVESTVQGHNAQCEMYVFPQWIEEDSFIPDLPPQVFPALLAEAKSTAFLVIKSVANEKAEQQSRRQQNILSQQGWRVHGGIRYPNYGRKR